MNFKGSLISQRNKRNACRQRYNWLLCLLYFAAVISSEPFYRESLFNFSLEYIEFIQGDHPKENFMLKIAKFISYLGSSVTMIPIIVLVYNWANVYKTFVLSMSYFLSTLLVSLMKMIYRSPRPYFVSEKILSLGCEGGWGNPSGHALCSTVFYLTLWEIFKDSGWLRRKKFAKYASLVSYFILILLIVISRNLVGAHSLNQILFGSQLGFGLYFFLFHVLCVKCNDSKQFESTVLKFKVLYFLILNLIVITAAICLYFFNKGGDSNQTMEAQYSKMIDEKCNTVPENRRFQNEALITFSLFLSNIGAFLGIKCDYYFTFSENFRNWRQFNFEIQNEEGVSDNDSVMTKITINKETQWNSTNAFYSIVRILVIIMFSLALLLPFYFVNWKDNFVLVLFCKSIIPSNLATFSLFYLLKIMFTKLSMVNMTLHSMLQDSL